MYHDSSYEEYLVDHWYEAGMDDPEGVLGLVEFHLERGTEGFRERILELLARVDGRKEGA